MRVFVAGATGVIGRRAVTDLLAAGHQVTAIARTPAKARWLQSLGAMPTGVSLFDPVGLHAAVVGHDAVVNLATKIPPPTQAALGRAWEENTRIRTEGSTNLVDAALAAGTKVYVQESIAFLYGEHGDEWVDAASAPLVDSTFSEPVRTAEANARRFTETGGRGVVLRFGMFQAAESDHGQALFRAARRGMLLDFRTADGYAPTIDVDDAATAVVAALEAPADVYDVVDDEPATRAELSAALARAVGRRHLRPLPARRLMTGRAGPLAQSQRVSNRRFRDATGWRPATRNQQAAIAKMAAEGDIAPAIAPFARLALWYLAAVGVALGVYALFFPQGFYDSFPFGRAWVAHDGPFNEHLVRDFGAMNLAMAAVTLVALYFGSLNAARAAAVGWLVFSVPHTLYHLLNLEHYETADQIGNVVTLTFSVAVAAVLLWMLARASTEPDAFPPVTTPSGPMREVQPPARAVDVSS